MPGSELEGAQRTEQMWHPCLWNMGREEKNRRKHKDELDRVKETGLPPAGENEIGEPSLNSGGPGDRKMHLWKDDFSVAPMEENRCCPEKGKRRVCLGSMWKTELTQRPWGRKTHGLISEG